MAATGRRARRAAGLLAAASLGLMLSGCGNVILERSYASHEPHSETYWISENADTLRAENYQELVNALMLLLGDHAEDGAVRVYGDHPNVGEMSERACGEVQQDTALGAYLLDYITYQGSMENGYYELTVRFGYRRTAEEQKAVVNATSTEALPDLLRDAVEAGSERLAVRIGYFATDRAGILSMVRGVYEEFYPPQPEPEQTPDPDATQEEDEAVDAAPDAQTDDPAEPENTSEMAEDAAETPPESEGEAASETEEWNLPWQVLFYPDEEHPGIVEVVLHAEEAPSPNEDLPA